jgi:uncharacterized damage-inducible protein DinB
VFTLDGIRKFHGWTHACLSLLLDHLSSIPATDYGKVLPAVGFPTLREQVIHIFNCEGFWVHTLQGLSYVDRSSAQCPAVSDARLFEQEVIQQTHTYLSGLTDRQLNSDTELNFSDGDVAIRTLGTGGRCYGAWGEIRQVNAWRVWKLRPEEGGMRDRYLWKG